MKDIKTRESKRDIKTLDRASGLARVTKNTAVRTKDQVQNLSDDGQITPDEYAEDKIKYMAERAVEDTGKATRKTAKKTYDSSKRLYKEIRRTRKETDSIKQTAKSTGKATTKTLQKSIKTGQRTVKTAQQTAKTTVKTAKKTAKAAKKTAEASAKAAKMAAQAARQAAQAAYKAAVVTAKAIAAAVKAAIAGIKALVAAIAAGGWVAVVIIVVICLIALIAGSCFGIFFSGDDTGNGLNMQTVISDMNAEYQAKINETKGTVAYDVLEMSGARAVWPEVLSVYAVKTAGDPNNPQEVASMDESKRQILKEIFWAMNEISFNTASRTENVVTATDDGNGNIVETTESVTRTYLYIRVTHKTPDEMAQQYGFTDEQKEQLRELLSDKNKKMWNGVLYGYTASGEDIVSVALSQLGNKGGEPYWRWYGFGSRVEWCCCFVSWCANECGYIDAGVIPKYAGTSTGVNWFKERGQWLDGSAEPSPGMIIFYGSVLRCADCGRVMKYVRSYSRPKKDGVVTDYYNYKCPTNIELGDTACSKKSIRADDLDKIVLSVIRKQMDLFLDTQKTLLGLIALEKEKAKHSVPANRVKELQDKLDQKKKLFSRLYIDFKDGILTQQEYLLARDVYQKEIAAYESELQELQAIKTKTKVTETGARKWNRLISRYYKTKTVTEEMVEAMVDEIRVNTDGSLDIRFKYMPEFEEMFKECERIRKEVA